MARKTKAAIDPALAQRLLGAVLATPGDDEPRRVYADFLQSHGDPRGEFIIVQCELARDPTPKPLWDRFRELHSRHSGKWTKPLKGFGRYARWWLHRGFVRSLEIDTSIEDGDARLAEVLAIEPVVDLAINGDEAPMQKLLAVPGLERLTRLVLYGWTRERQGAFIGRLAATAERLTEVRELRLGVKLGDAGFAALAKPVALGKVTHLAIGGGGLQSVAAFEELAASPLGQRLEILEWLRDPVAPELAKLVVALPKLHTFAASYGRVDAANELLRERFGDRFVIENEPGMSYLSDGVEGVAPRRIPKR